MEEKTFTGIGVSEGVRVAKAFVFRRPAVDRERTIRPEQADAEAKRFRAAVQAAEKDVDRLIEQAAGVIAKEEAGVLKGQKSILSDPAYIPEIEKLIRGKNHSAERAVSEVTEKFASLFAAMPNPYLRERAADVRDAGNRLICFLAGVCGPDLSEISGEVILIADDLSASDTVRLNRSAVLAFATEQGGRTSHTSIFAKSMGVPAVVGAKGITAGIASGDTVVIDGGKGLLIARPGPATLKTYAALREEEERRRALFETFAHRAGALADGTRVVTAANIGTAAEAAFALGQGAEAVGLMRTEQLFLLRASAPDEQEQFAAYKAVAETFSKKAGGPGEVLIRTLDIGGDKEAAYLHLPHEANPFLGQRAIRLCLAEKPLFLTQLRAILRASAFGRVGIMFPMIAGPGELRAAKAVLAEAKAGLDREGAAYDRAVRVGIMVEVPSAALMADALAREVDFFSIGTNDLTQYTLAADRGNPDVAALYDYFHPAVLRLIRETARAARKNGIPVGMCGGMAGDPLAIPLLVGLGLDELSMPAGALPQAKYILSRLDKASCETLAAHILTAATSEETRAAAAAFTAACSGR